MSDYATLAAGRGSIFGVYFGQQPHFDLVDRLNLSDGDHSIIRVRNNTSSVHHSHLALLTHPLTH
jgi:hypothetical protein